MNRQRLARIALIGAMLIGMALVAVPVVNTFLRLNSAPGADAPAAGNMLPLVGESVEDSAATAAEIAVPLTSGKVMVRAPGQEEYQAYNPALALRPGSALRTLSDGAATIKIGNDIEMALGPNSQVELVEYVQLGGQKYIKVTQIVGEVIYRVDFAEDSGSTFVAETPWGDVNVIGTSFRISIVLEEYTLPSGEIDWADLLQSTPADDEVLITVDVNTGQVRFSYVDPETGEVREITIDPNETLTLDSALELLEVTPSNAACGDGVCDPYEDEDAESCPADCDGG